MKQIIKHGNVPQKRMLCISCGCLFEYGPLDVSNTKHKEGQSFLNFVKCPDCGQILFLGDRER